MNAHAGTLRGKERYRSGVLEYKRMGYWEPDYVPKDTDARMVALSFGTPNAVAAESAADTFSYCEPSIDDATRETVCIFSGGRRPRSIARNAIASTRCRAR